MSRDAIDLWMERMPEQKLELIHGRFTVGNGVGNRQLLHHILEGWGAAAALWMAPQGLWLQAIHRTFESFSPPPTDAPLSAWREWSVGVDYTPHLPPAGPCVDGPHHAFSQSLLSGLFWAAGSYRFAKVSGRDIVMRLGESAFTPDAFAAGPERARRFNDRYLDGPADLVIEVLLRGHEAYDRQTKRDHYAAAGVREYWLIDPIRQECEFLRHDGAGFCPHPPDADGKYRSSAFPGLVFRPQSLWDREDAWGLGQRVFAVEGDLPTLSGSAAEGYIAWGDLPFDPRLDLEPGRISFEEFAAWTPRAKFESPDGKPSIGSRAGTRNVLGMILRTEGLVEAVGVLHPGDWVSALARAEEERAADGERRQRWWERTRQAVALLREQFGLGPLTLIGDLVGERPLHLWSDVTLVARDLDASFDRMETGRFLYERFRQDPPIHLCLYRSATRAEQQAVESEGIEV